MSPDLLDKILTNPRLPSLPAIAARVVEMVQDPSLNVADLADAIAHDQALSTKILRTVNSSFYGLRIPCATVSQAIVILGLPAVKALVLGFTLVPALNSGATGFDYVSYWRRGLYTGIAARAIARAASLPCAEECFVGGLLQDLGMIALHQGLGSIYEHILAQAASSGEHRALARLEISQLETQHADVGSMLARRWKLPDSLVMAIKYHERPTAAPAEQQPLIRAVALGNIAADIMTVPEPAGPLTRFYNRAEQWFGLTREASDTLLKQIGNSASETASLFRLAAGQFPDAEAILSQAHQRLLSMTLPQAQDPTEDADAIGASPAAAGSNHLLFEQSLIATFEQARAGAGPLAVVLFDLDGLATINTVHSVATGDAALMATLRRLAEAFDPVGATVYALDPGRFAVILARTDRTTATRLADQARRRIASSPLPLDAHGAAVSSLQASISAGLACMDATTTDRFADAADLLRLADQALRAAKGAGRNTMRIYAPSAAAA